MCGRPEVPRILGNSLDCWSSLNHEEYRWWAQQDSNLRHADYESFLVVFCLVSLSAAWFGSVGFLKPFP